MIAERTFQGAWKISGLNRIGQHLVTRQYFDYTKHEAIVLFHAELRPGTTDVLTGIEDPSGTIFAGVNDVGEPYAGIVIGGYTSIDGRDRWVILDAHEDIGVVVAEDVVVFDDARAADLRTTLLKHEAR